MRFDNIHSWYVWAALYLLSSPSSLEGSSRQISGYTSEVNQKEWLENLKARTRGLLNQSVTLHSPGDEQKVLL